MAETKSETQFSMCLVLTGSYSLVRCFKTDINNKSLKKIRFHLKLSWNWSRMNEIARGGLAPLLQWDASGGLSQASLSRS